MATLDPELREALAQRAEPDDQTTSSMEPLLEQRLHRQDPEGVLELQAAR